MVKFTVTSFDSAHHWLFGLCSESVSAGSSENFSFERRGRVEVTVAATRWKCVWKDEVRRKGSEEVKRKKFEFKKFAAW